MEESLLAVPQQQIDPPAIIIHHNIFLAIRRLNDMEQLFIVKFIMQIHIQPTMTRLIMQRTQRISLKIS